MNKRDHSRRKDIRASQRRQDSHRGRTYSLMLVCGLMLVSGFFFAGRQHFSSMDFGIKNSRLRRQIDELEAEKRRLLLAREVSLSPMEIKKAAKKAGMNDVAAVAGEVAQLASATKEKATPPSPASPAKAMVVKTADVSPVRPAAPAVMAALPRQEKPAKAVAKAMSAE